MSTLPSFQSKSGVAIGTVTPGQHIAMLQELTDTFGLRWPQICEAAGYSFTMVVRYALGLSAQGGKVVALASECLAGWVALAAARQLANAGATLHVVLVLDPGKSSPELEAQVHTLQQMGVPVEHWSFRQDVEQFASLIEESHNVLCGLHGHPEDVHTVVEAYSAILNELSTPVHCVLCPPGVEAESGTLAANALVASSTLSLGAPLSGLFYAQENAGRHYIADISCPVSLYEKLGLTAGTLFAEQPVTQLSPIS